MTFISAGDVGFPSHYEFTDWVLDTAHYMLALASPPQVMTTSYGDNERISRMRLQSAFQHSPSTSIRELIARNEVLCVRHMQPWGQEVSQCSSVLATVASLVYS